MNWRVVKTVAAKDLHEVLLSRNAVIAAVVVPLLFITVLPFAIIVLPQNMGVPMGKLMADIGPFVYMMRFKLGGLAETMTGLNDLQGWIVIMLGFLLAPLFLTLPLMFASLVGADAFVGEKERKTLETLLFTPASDADLLLGKILASIIPAVVITWVAFFIYALVVNAVSWPVMERLWFPTATWWPLIFWLAPALATLGMAVTVLVSQRVSTHVEANQLTGSLVLLVIGLLAGQIAGVIFLNDQTTILAGAILWIADAFLIWLGARRFERGKLIARL
jgi:ABC-type Na+ efflux pump permease subunit